MRQLITPILAALITITAMVAIIAWLAILPTIGGLWLAGLLP